MGKDNVICLPKQYTGIEKEINKLNKIIMKLQHQIRLYMESNDILDIKEGNPIYKLCMIRNLGKVKLKNLIKNYGTRYEQKIKSRGPE